MKIKVNRDLRDFKTNDVGSFSLKQIKFMAIGVAIAILVGISEYLLTGKFNEYIATTLGGIPVFLGLFKYNGLTIPQYLNTVFAEEHLQPKILFYRKEESNENQ